MHSKLHHTEKTEKSEDKEGWYPGKLAGKMFGSKSEKKGVEKASTLDAFLGKFSSDQRKDLSELHGISWELDDNVLNCRECDTSFSTFTRKHHCRGCGGVFCDKCCIEITDKSNDKVKHCGGCRRGESAGDKIKALAEAIITARTEEQSVQPAVYFKLHTESMYATEHEVTERRKSFSPGGKANANINISSKNSAPVKAIDGIAPVSGYFELLNKSEEICAIKLLHSGGDIMHELPRPCYTLVPPGECVSCLFDPETNSVDLLVLVKPRCRAFNAKGVVNSSVKTTVFDPKLASYVNSPTPVFNCDCFEEAACYRIACRGCNVLLKAKGSFGGYEVVPRRGNSVARIGPLAKIIGSRAPLASKREVDFATNIESCVVTYQSYN